MGGKVGDGGISDVEKPGNGDDGNLGRWTQRKKFVPFLLKAEMKAVHIVGPR